MGKAYDSLLQIILTKFEDNKQNRVSSFRNMSEEICKLREEYLRLNSERKGLYCYRQQMHKLEGMKTQIDQVKNDCFERVESLKT